MVKSTFQGRRLFWCLWCWLATSATVTLLFHNDGAMAFSATNTATGKKMSYEQQVEQTKNVVQQSIESRKSELQQAALQKKQHAIAIAEANSKKQTAEYFMAEKQRELRQVSFERKEASANKNEALAMEKAIEQKKLVLQATALEKILSAANEELERLSGPQGSTPAVAAEETAVPAPEKNEVTPAEKARLERENTIKGLQRGALEKKSAGTTASVPEMAEHEASVAKFVAEKEAVEEPTVESPKEDAATPFFAKVATPESPAATTEDNKQEPTVAPAKMETPAQPTVAPKPLVEESIIKEIVKEEVVASKVAAVVTNSPPPAAIAVEEKKVVVEKKPPVVQAPPKVEITPPQEEAVEKPPQKPVFQVVKLQSNENRIFGR